MQQLQAPPHSKIAEESLLSNIVHMPEYFGQVAWMKSEDFYFPTHRKIWELIVDLDSVGTPPDLPTVMTASNGSLKLDDVEAIVNPITLSRKIVHYAQAIRKLSTRRKLILGAQEVMAMGYDINSDLDEILDSSESKMLAVREGQDSSETIGRDFKEICRDVAKDLQDRHDNDGGMTGIPTGIEDLDEITAGFQRKDLIIVAGRPSMGKTAFAVGVARGAAKIGHKTLIFSFEMDEGKLVERVISAEGRVNSKRMRNGQFRDDDWDRITNGFEKTVKLPCHVVHRQNMSVMEIRAYARRRKRNVGLDMIIIDYLGYIRLGRANSTPEAVGDAVRSLKGLASELNVPVVLIAQLNRKVDDRPDKRPLMSDLKSSGDIEQDADLIIFPYRESVYCDDCKKGTCTIDKHSKRGEAIVAKQRNGETGTVKMMWHGEITSYENVPEGTNW